MVRLGEALDLSGDSGLEDSKVLSGEKRPALLGLDLVSGGCIGDDFTDDAGLSFNIPREIASSSGSSFPVSG